MGNRRFGPAEYDHRHYWFVRQSGLSRRDFGVRDWDSIGDRAVLIACIVGMVLLLSCSTL
jgi:hypothetical protein